MDEEKNMRLINLCTGEVIALLHEAVVKELKKYLDEEFITPRSFISRLQL
jgi:hypothetical protein